MSLREVSLVDIVLKQYFFKVKAYAGFISGLIMLQLVAVLMVSGGTGGMGSSNDNLTVNIRAYSTDIVIAFTLIWIFLLALTLTTSQSKKVDFALVTNRVSANLANIGLLLTFGLFGGVTSTLSGVLLREVIYFTADRTQIIAQGFFLAFGDLLLSAFAGSLYMILIAAIGYFLGVLAKGNTGLAVLMFIVLAGLVQANLGFLDDVWDFFTTETSVILFMLKTMLAAAALFGLSIAVSNRMEVKA